jgi:membrane protein DedA with SNARE-associated domain
MHGSFADLVSRYGYALVFVLVGAEGIGIPLPGETALLTAAALAARGHLSIIGVVISAAVGVALGGPGGYWIGCTAGHTAVTRFGSWAGITPARLEDTRQFFARYGARAIIVGRFLPVVRILTGVVTGITEMPFRQFAVYNAIAGVVWSVVFGTAGYVFGRDLPRLENRLGRVGLVAIGVVVAAGAAVVFWRGHRGHRGHRGRSGAKHR